MRRAAIYSRKSKYTEKGESINNQIKVCKDYLIKSGEGYEFLIYEDDGFSGKSTERPQFKKMMLDAKARKFDTLICYRLDRVSRNTADFTILLLELDKYGIGFISVNELFDTKTPMGRAMMYIASVFAQLERETIAERIRDNMLELSKTGRWLGGMTPTGFQSSALIYINSDMKEKKMYKLEPIQSELETVNLIYSKFLDTHSINSVAKFLTDNNIKTKLNTAWSYSKVKTILENPVYVRANQATVDFIKSSKGGLVTGTPDGIHGILTYNKKKYKSGPFRNMQEWIYAIGNHEGTISSEDWLKVQKLLLSNKMKAPRLGKTSTALLTGILKCGICGGNMKITYGSLNMKTGERHYYYTCSCHRKNNFLCSNKNIRGDLLEKAVIEGLSFISIDKGTLGELLSNSEKSNSYNLVQAIQKNDNAVSNLIQSLSLTSDKIAAQLILDKIQKITAKNRKLEEELESIKRDESICQFSIGSYNLPEVIAASNPEEKKLILKAIIDKAFWYGDKNELYLKLKGS